MSVSNIIHQLGLLFSGLFAGLGRPDALDLTHQAHYFWAFLPEIVLSLGGMAVLLMDVFQKGNRSEPSRPSVGWLSIWVLVLTGFANFAIWGVTDVSGRGLVAMDQFRFITNLIYLLGAALALLLSFGYLDRRGINRGEYHALVLFATLGMMLMGGAQDLMMIFIGLEVMSIAVYVLVGFDRLDPRSSEGSLKYFLLGAFSSAFFLYGIALVWGSLGTTHIAEMAQRSPVGSPVTPMLLGGMGLLMIGFGFKVAAMPFHLWTPDAYDGAPTPITSLMSTGVKAAAFAAFIRVFMVGFTGHWDWRWTILMLAAVTMFGANLIALTQGSIKRMLAYSSIAHAGYLLVALLANSPRGAGAFLFYLVVYTLMTAGAFGLVIANSREDGEERVALEDWAGFASQKPGLAALFSIFLLSLAGFPLTAGFLGKLFILRAIVEARLPFVAALLVIASLISYFYYLRVVVVMYMRPARDANEHAAAHLPFPGMVAVVASAALVVGLFFFGGTPLRWAENGACSIFASLPRDGRMVQCVQPPAAAQPAQQAMVAQPRS
jgi:NADH-quinone oxidoreductase subunit N